MDTTLRRPDLFPAIEPHRQGYLDLDSRHRMYWEESGNPDGQPILFVHGGPGAGSSPVHRRFFDPAHYRIIVFDQRGCGRSTPHGEVAENTTAHLINDMERLRIELGVERWLIFGGSWGSTLALAYGIAHPKRCDGFILRGVFLARQSELDWFLDGMGAFFPDQRRRFISFLPEGEQGDPLAAYHRRLVDRDPAVHGPAAITWCRYESGCSNLLPRDSAGDRPATNSPLFDRGDIGRGPVDRGALALARIEAHYFVNRMFLEEGQLLNGLKVIYDVPAIIVQGRYDIVCPITSADLLAQNWPLAELVVVPDAGHSALEPGTRSELVAATERFKFGL